MYFEVKGIMGALFNNILLTLGYNEYSIYCICEKFKKISQLHI